MTATLDDAPDTTWTLVQRVQAGDTQAFAPIYTTYHKTVFNFVHYRLRYNRALAEDITSETFTKALRNIGSFTWQGRDFGAWLVTIARNLVADHFKSGQNRLETLVGEVFHFVEAAIDESPEGRPADTVAGHLANLDMLRALEELSPDQHDVIVLRFLHGLNVAETAAVLRRDVTAVRALQTRAVGSLRRAMPEGWTR